MNPPFVLLLCRVSGQPQHPQRFLSTRLAIASKERPPAGTHHFLRSVLALAKRQGDIPTSVSDGPLFEKLMTWVEMLWFDLADTAVPEPTYENLDRRYCHPPLIKQYFRFSHQYNYFRCSHQVRPNMKSCCRLTPKHLEHCLAPWQLKAKKVVVFVGFKIKLKTKGGWRAFRGDGFGGAQVARPAAPRSRHSARPLGLWGAGISRLPPPPSPLCETPHFPGHFALIFRRFPCFKAGHTPAKTHAPL
jgi:hypothetical protein